MGNNLLAAGSGKQVCTVTVVCTAQQLQRLVFRTNFREWALKISLKAQGGRQKESDVGTE